MIYGIYSCSFIKQMILHKFLKSILILEFSTSHIVQLDYFEKKQTPAEEGLKTFASKILMCVDNSLPLLWSCHVWLWTLNLHLNFSWYSFFSFFFFFLFHDVTQLNCNSAKLVRKSVTCCWIFVSQGDGIYILFLLLPLLKGRMKIWPTIVLVKGWRKKNSRDRKLVPWTQQKICSCCNFIPSRNADRQREHQENGRTGWSIGLVVEMNKTWAGVHLLGLGASKDCAYSPVIIGLAPQNQATRASVDLPMMLDIWGCSYQ